MTDQQPRIPPATASELDPETVKLMGIIGRQHDGQPDNIFATLARHPDLLKSFLPLGSHILMNSTLPPRDREILILRVAWLCHSEYEWGQHLVIAGQAGLSGEEISRIRLGAEAPGWSELESLLIQAVDELHSSTVISEETWQALAGFYDTRQLMDLVFTVGQYHLVAMALKSFGVLLDQRLTGFEAEAPSS